MARSNPEHAAPELSRPIVLTTVPAEGQGFRLESTPRERAALAKRFDLLDLPALDAEGEISVSNHGRRARVEGIIRARVVQSCVVTLDPVEVDIEERFVRTYAVSPSTSAGQEIVVDVEGEDPPEPVVNGMVDIGEAVAETLGLALDPYPRAPGVELPGVDAAEEGEKGRAPAESGRESPFSALKGLLKRL